MTEDEQKRVDQILTELNGDKVKAAKVLGITAEQMRDKIHKNKILKSKWVAVKKPPSEIDTLSGNEDIPPSEDEPVLQSDRELAKAFKKEDTKFKKGVITLALSDKEIQLAVSLQEFQGKHYKSITDMMTGGCTRKFIQLQLVMDGIEKRLKEFQKGGGGDEMAIFEEKMLWEQYYKGIEAMRKLTELGFNGALISAKVKKMSHSGKSGGRPRGKAGFTPLQNNEVQDVEVIDGKA